MRKCVAVFLIFIIVFSATGCKKENVRTAVQVCFDKSQELVADEYGFKYNIGDYVYNTNDRCHKLMELPENVGLVFDPVWYSIKKNRFPEPIPLYSAKMVREKRVLKYLDKQYTLEYDYSSKTKFESIAFDYYIDKQNDMKIGFSGFNEVVYFYAGKAVVRTKLPAPKNEKELKEICENFVSSLKNNFVYKTTCQVLRDGEITDGFVHPQQLKQGDRYVVTYLRYSNKLPSNDVVTIEVNRDGSLYSFFKAFPHGYRGSSQYIYDNEDLRDRDFSAVEEKMLEEFERMCKVKGFKLVKYECEKRVAKVEGYYSLHMIIQPEMKKVSTGEVFYPQPAELIMYTDFI